MNDAKSSDTFSVRNDIDDAKKKIQSDDIDDDLKNSIWNAVFRYYMDVGKIPSEILIHEDSSLKIFFEKIMYDFYKVPADTTINGYLSHGIEEVRELYYDLEWNEVYDFMEFLANNISEQSAQDADNLSFVEYCNKILERENSSFRFVENKIKQITKDDN